MTLKNRTCDRCGEEYEGYLFFVRDSFPDIVDHVDSEYDNLCKPCRAFLHPEQFFNGANEVEPKEKVG